MTMILGSCFSESSYSRESSLDIEGINLKSESASEPILYSQSHRLRNKILATYRKITVSTNITVDSAIDK